MVTKEKNCLGRCPKCNSDKLDYGMPESDNEHIYYPFTCKKCKTQGKEYYEVEYWATLYEVPA